MNKILFFTFAFLSVNILTKSFANKLQPYIDDKKLKFPTLEPINIITSLAKPVFTPVPLTVVGSLIYFSKATQTGSTLIVEVPPPPSAFGGVLHNDVYGLFQREFFWDLELKRSAAVKMDGYGAYLQVVNSLYNMKYHNVEEAMKKPDGIAQVVNFINVTSVFNPLFYPTQLKLSKMKKAGSSAIISEFFNFVYLYTPSITQEYYFYFGTYTNPVTGKKYNSSIVIVPIRIPTPTISVEQYLDVFESFENEKGKNYSNILETQPADHRPIGKTSGIILTIDLLR